MEKRTQINTYNQQQELNAVVDRLKERIENKHAHYENVKRASIEARKEEKARKRQEKQKEKKGSWKEHKYELPKELKIPEDQPKVNKWEFIQRVNADMILWKDKDGKPCYNYMNAVGVERNVNNYGKFESLDD